MRSEDCPAWRRHARPSPSTTAVLSGTPCVKETRIPACDIAEMLANGDGIGAIHDAWPVLTVEQIEAAALYTRAYPRRGRPRTPPAWRSRKPVASDKAALDELPGLALTLPDRRMPEPGLAAIEARRELAMRPT